MSASDPNQGFPTGDQDGGGRPAEPADASADQVRSGADPASSADPADSVQQPEAATGGGAEPDPDAAEPGAASGGDPAGGAETTGPWRSAVANRPPRAGGPEAAGDETAGADLQERSAAYDGAGDQPEPAQGAYQDPSRAAQDQQPWAHPQEPGQAGPAQHAPYPPGAYPGPGGVGGPAAWSGVGAGAGAGAAGHPGGHYGPYGPGSGAGAGGQPGGWNSPGAHPGGPGHPGGGYPPPPYGEGHPGDPQGDQPRKPSFFRRNAVIVVAAVTALITSLIVGPAAAALTAYLTGGGGTSALSGDSEGSVSSGDVSAVADQALPSVVSIEAGQGAGSGVIISSDGRILTNAHVVSAAEGDTVAVAFNDGSEARAQILGSDPVSDLAVIEARDQSGLTTAKLGNSDKVEVGADVVAIGSPLGLQGTVTNGVVSAVDRPVNTGMSGQPQQPQQPEQPQEPENPFGLPEEEQPQEQQEQQLQTSTVINAIQTDAPINPGNSGGPLMNMSGEVIGINTAIASTGGMGQAGSIGLGFSIPINQAKPIAQQLIENGEADYAAIEATITRSNEEGSRIVETRDGGAAEQAGLERGDRVTHVNGEEVDDPSALIAAIRSHQPGDTITISYVRDGEEHETDVTLSAQSSDSLNG